MDYEDLFSTDAILMCGCRTKCSSIQCFLSVMFFSPMPLDISLGSRWNEILHVATSHIIQVSPLFGIPVLLNVTIVLLCQWVSYSSFFLLTWMQFTMSFQFIHLNLSSISILFNPLPALQKILPSPCLYWISIIVISSTLILILCFPSSPMSLRFMADSETQNNFFNWRYLKYLDKFLRQILWSLKEFTG